MLTLVIFWVAMPFIILLSVIFLNEAMLGVMVQFLSLKQLKMMACQV